MVKKYCLHVFGAICLIQFTLLQGAHQNVSPKTSQLNQAKAIELEGELILAAKENNLVGVEKFIKAGAIQKANKNNVIIALSHAATHGNKDMVFSLLRAGVTAGKYFWIAEKKNNFVKQYNEETEKIIYQETLQVLEKEGLRDVASLIAGYAVELVEEPKATLM